MLRKQTNVVILDVETEILVNEKWVIAKIESIQLHWKKAKSQWTSNLAQLSNI